MPHTRREDTPKLNKSSCSRRLVTLTKDRKLLSLRFKFLFKILSPLVVKSQLFLLLQFFYFIQDSCQDSKHKEEIAEMIHINASMILKGTLFFLKIQSFTARQR